MKWLAALLLILCSCLGADYHTHVMPTIAPAVQQAALAAVASWERAVPVKLDVSISGCPGTSDICVYPVTGLPELPWEPGELAGLTIYHTVLLAEPLLEADTPHEAQRVIAHELGHAMGLQHDKPGTLMYPCSPDPEGCTAYEPTAADVRQWYALRGQVPPSK